MPQLFFQTFCQKFILPSVHKSTRIVLRNNLYFNAILSNVCSSFLNVPAWKSRKKHTISIYSGFHITTYIQGFLPDLTIFAIFGYLEKKVRFSGKNFFTNKIYNSCRVVVKYFTRKPYDFFLQQSGSGNLHISSKSHRFRGNSV